MAQADTRITFRRSSAGELTDTKIRAAKPHKEPYKLRDGAGLYLDVRPTGARLWRYRYRIGGKENLFAIGAFPEISLAQAREDRDAARKLVRKGIHPAHQRKTDKIRAAYENANTFEAVAREWLKANEPHWTPRTYRQRERLLERDVFPKVGTLPLRQVTPAHAHQIITRIAARAPQMAVIARQCFSAVSALGIATMRADTDVSYPLRHSVKLAATQHKRPLRPSQIPDFFKALDQYAGYFPTKAAIRLQWLTLVRPGEIVGARWNEFDLEEGIWTIPAERMKMRQTHTVPLPTQALELLRLLRSVTGASEYLVPNRTHPKRHASDCILSKAFDAMGYANKLSPHGVRVTGRTILGEQAHPRDLLERQLAHREKKVVRAYDQGDRLEARRKIMQGWADYLDGLVSGGADVVNIKAAAS
jgi:integrase